MGRVKADIALESWLLGKASCNMLTAGAALCSPRSEAASPCSGVKIVALQGVKQCPHNC